MYRPQIVMALALSACVACQAQSTVPEEYLEAGERAYELTAEVVALGPRPSGSAANAEQQRLIAEKLRRAGCDVQQIGFQAETPKGPVAMKNILCRFGGTSRRPVVISGHYDTYARPGLEFVGANDAGSSTGLLLAMAERLKGRALADPVWLVFLDGEESTVEWSGLDHTYGSRKLAEMWVADGTKERVKAIINVDMIGDRDLKLLYEGNSTPWLRELVFDTAHRLGYAEQFPKDAPGYIEDDHIEFLTRGFPALDLIDFEYGFFNGYWHTEADSMDKLDARSFAILLHVLEESLHQLTTRP